LRRRTQGGTQEQREEGEFGVHWGNLQTG
jgi:hypothetical protein